MDPFVVDDNVRIKIVGISASMDVVFKGFGANSYEHVYIKVKLQSGEIKTFYLYNTPKHNIEWLETINPKKRYNSIDLISFFNNL
jgi:hypothetical protein